MFSMDENLAPQIGLELTIFGCQQMLFDPLLGVPATGWLNPQNAAVSTAVDLGGLDSLMTSAITRCYDPKNPMFSTP